MSQRLTECSWPYLLSCTSTRWELILRNLNESAKLCHSGWHNLIKVPLIASIVYLLFHSNNGGQGWRSDICIVYGNFPYNLGKIKLMRVHATTFTLPPEPGCSAYAWSACSIGVATVANKNTPFVILVGHTTPIDSKLTIVHVLKPVFFYQIQQIHCTYNSLRCLDLQSW